MTQIKLFDRKRKDLVKPVATGAGILFRSALTAASGWILYSKLAIDHNLPLPNAILADRVEFGSQAAGKISYYVDRRTEGRPLVLIHSVNAAASSYEMRPLFDHYRSQRPVYALDLPGYGFSDRSSRDYYPQLFRDVILEMLESQVGEPADVIALSLGCEFAAQAAFMQPEHFHSLVLISPSGFNRRKSGSTSQQANTNGFNRLAYTIFSFPLWGRPLFDLLTTRRVIEYYLRQSFVGPIPQGMVDYDYSTAHQPGAENVPLFFLSGKLFTPDVREQFYENIHIPTLVLFDLDPYVNFDMLPDLLSKNENWRAERIAPTLGLPHFEKNSETIRALDEFWQSISNGGEEKTSNI